MKLIIIFLAPLFIVFATEAAHPAHIESRWRECLRNCDMFSRPDNGTRSPKKCKKECGREYKLALLQFKVELKYKKQNSDPDDDFDDDDDRGGLCG